LPLIQPDLMAGTLKRLAMPDHPAGCPMRRIHQAAHQQPGRSPGRRRARLVKV